MHKIATLEGLMREWEVEERLGAMIDKCLKRLLFVRGLKSLNRAPEVIVSPPTTTRLLSRRRQGQNARAKCSEAETEGSLGEHDVHKMATLEGLMREWEVEDVWVP